MQAKITKTIMDYAEYRKPHIGKSKTSTDKAGKYVDRLGEIAGEVHLVKGWYGLGGSVSNEQNIASCTKFNL